MDFDIVVKVKYGDTLRRFTANVNYLGVIDLTMDGLRAKSLDFFNLSSETDLTFTYVDEDGDVVTLGEDDDLRDAVIVQHLNPLRINVLSKASKAAASDTKSQSESSASTIAPIQIEPSSRISPSVEDALKYVPEPLLSALLKVSNDLIAKAGSSAPVLTELGECYSNLAPLFATFRRPRNSSDNAVDLNASAAFEAPVDAVGIPKVEPKSTSVDKSLGENLNCCDGDKMTRDLRTSDPIRTPVDLNLNLPREDNTMPGGSSAKVPVHESNSAAALSSFTPNVTHHMGLNPYPSQSSGAAKESIPEIHDMTYVFGGEKNKQSPLSLESSPPQVGVNHQNNGLINGVIGADASDTVTGGLYPTGYASRKGYGLYDSMLRTFHRGIRCDGCGMLPIIGLRFKSKVKDDYDLCNICFSEMGNEADYIRIEHTNYRQPRLFYPHPRFHSPSSHPIRGCGMKSCRPKLESRFIQDVTILDGTLVSPNTPLTKIWRMRNNGTTVWPHGTQLVWIGGDKLGDRVSVELEIPANGFPVNKELDIAVDFMAPTRSGRYISYWRMASPSGQKFGQRVWVLIQVDTELMDAGLSFLSGSFSTGLNLNLPPENNGQKGKGLIVDVNVQPLDADPFIPDLPLPSNVVAESIEPLIDEPPSRREGFDFQVNNGSLVGGNGVPRPVPEVSTSVSYPIIDLSEPPPVVEMQAPPPAVTQEEIVEQTLLKELEEMGFKQTDLNKEILRKNVYDLEQSVEDLCSFTEWDPILEDLQEMGFTNRQMNKELLIKNGGSIKRVVLDLVAGEKE